jgi:hypothetical protein
LDRDRLREVADRIGPTVADISAKPDLSRHPHITMTGTLGFREMTGAWS